VLEQIDAALLPDLSSGLNRSSFKPDALKKMLRLEIAQHPNASSELIDAGLHLFEEDTAKLFAHPNSPAWLGALLRSSPGVSARNQARFMRFKVKTERLRLAVYRYASPEVLDELAKLNTGFEALQVAIAENPNVSISTLERIAYHHKDDVALVARNRLHALAWRGGALPERLFWPISVRHMSMFQVSSSLAEAMLALRLVDRVSRTMQLQRLEANRGRLKTPPVPGGVYLLKLAGSCLVKVISTDGDQDFGTVYACYWHWQVDSVACKDPGGFAAIRSWVIDLDLRRDFPGRVEAWSLEEFDACEPFLLEVCPVKELELEAVRNSRVEDIWNLPESLGGRSGTGLNS
jgi:hypothetical protein